MKQQLSIGLVALAALVIAAGGPAHTQGVLEPGIVIDGKPVRVWRGNVRGNVTFTNDSHWVLRGAVFVEDGATLNIQAGTRVVGEAGTIGTLIVSRGGRLVAIGTREAPIVFTSDQRPGSRDRGDWGGIIINGRAPLNVPGNEGVGEADTGIYGGDDENDDSGVLRYVRVEYAGTEFSPDNELNGIAFQGVGRGTQVDYVQVHMNRDDGLEWFGGTVDAKHVVLTNVGDDSIDWTFGWRGRLQFAVVSQRGDDADNGIEADNNEFNNEFLPRSAPQIYNITLCGDPDRNEGPESTRGMILRRGTAGVIRNFVVQGFKTSGIEVNGASSLRLAGSGELVVSHGAIFNVGASGAVWGPASTLPFFTNGTFPNVSLGVDPGIPGCYNHDAPSWRPTLASLAGGQMAPIQPPNDGFFEPVTHIGAVPATGDDWTTGWTNYAQR